MQVTPSEEQEFQQATHFHTCREELGANLVQEHCLLTGKVRGGGGGRPHVQFEVSIHESKFRSFFIISEATTPTSLCNSRVWQRREMVNFMFSNARSRKAKYPCR